MSNSILTAKETKIYRAYRHTLKSIPRHAGNPAGARKQQARQIVSVRYHIPISTLKTIIKAGEKIEGITHEHTDDYAAILPFTIAMRDAVAEFNINPVKMCDCGSTDSIQPRMHQYYANVKNRPMVVVSCFNCWENTKTTP